MSRAASEQESRRKRRKFPLSDVLLLGSAGILLGPIAYFTLLNERPLRAPLAAIAAATPPGEVQPAGQGEKGFAAAPAPPGQLESVVENGNLSIFYRTNEHALEPRHEADLTAFVHASGPQRTWTVEGHCDERGGLEYNLALGERRAAAVGEWLFANTGGLVSTVSYGEASPRVEDARPDALAHNRRAVVVPGTPSLARAFELLPADAYVLDASGSMYELDILRAIYAPVVNDMRRVLEKDILGFHDTSWGEVATFPFPEGAVLHPFNSCIMPRTGLEQASKETLRNITPGCGSPVWEAAARTLKEAQYGSITLLSDGVPTADSASPDSVIALAKEQGTRVNVIGFKVPDALQADLLRVARETGGRFYLSGR